MNVKLYFSHGVLTLLLLSLFSSCQTKQKQDSTSTSTAQEEAVQPTVDRHQLESLLAYYDSLYTVSQPQLEQAKKGFRFEKNERYEQLGHYVHRLLMTNSNVERNYVQVYVKENAELIIKFYYVGARGIMLQSVTASAGEVQQSCSGSAYQYHSDATHEILTNTGVEAEGFLSFVAAYQQQRIRVQYQGEKGSYVFYLSDADKSALVQSYQLYVLMRDLQELQDYREKTLKALAEKSEK